MWVVEGLTHRYPTKVLAEVLSTCPQYCGHCTRMDLVGNDAPQVEKKRFVVPQQTRYEQILAYLRRTPCVRDVVVSGGDVANLPIGTLEAFVSALLDIPNIRDIRLATKGFMAIPQHFLQDSVLAAWSGLPRRRAARRRAGPAHARQQRPPGHAAGGTRRAQAAGDGLPRRAQPGRAPARRERPRRRTCSSCASRCRTTRSILPYYFYMCDMIPNSEHWRVSVAEAQKLQHDIMGYLPGFATPRIVCDVPFVGKRWVHQVAEYDRERGHLLLDEELPDRHRS